MAGDGTSFEIDVDVQAGGVEPAAASLATLADRLSAAGQASQAAADAVKAGEAAYAQAEATANRAAMAVEKIGLAADAQRGKLQAALDAGDVTGADKAAAKLQNLLARQEEAAAKAAEASDALNREAASLDALKVAASDAAGAEAKAAEAFDAAKAAEDADEAADAASRGTGEARAAGMAFGRLGGPLGHLGQMAFGTADAMKKLQRSLGDAGPYAAIAIAVVAVVAGLAALSAAAVSATVKIGVWAVQLADSARSSKLLADGIAGSVAGGTKLNDKIAQLANTVPQSRDELMQMASDLAKTGLRGDALSAALETAAVKAAKLKWGPDFAKQMLSLDKQTERLKTNIAGVFGGLKIEALLEGLSKLVALFDETSVTGKAIKVVFESLFQPLIDGTVAFIPKARTAFIQFEILVLRALIAIKPWGSTILLVVEILGVLAAVVMGVLAIALALIIVNLTIIAVAIGVVVTVVAALVAGALYLTQVFMSLAASIINGAVDAFHRLMDYLSGLSLTQVGTDIITGLANGITAGGAAVLSAITGVVSGAITSAKKTLGIASPSKVFAEIGQYTAEGMQGGVEGSSGGVQSALETMVAPPDAAAGGTSAPSSSGGPGAGGGGSGANLAGAIFNFYGVQGAEDAEDRFRALLTRVLEGDVAQLGSEVPA